MAVWTPLSFDYGQKLTAAEMNQLQANFTAMAEGASGAPPITPASFGDYAAGDNLLIRNRGEVSTTVISPPTKVKEILLGRGGTLRIKFELKTTSAYSACGAMYKNGTRLGDWACTTSQTYVTISQDVSGWSAGDLLQLYIYIDSIGTAYARNLYLYADEHAFDPINILE